MKILKNAGNFRILTPKDELVNQLLRIEQAGRTCYQSLKKEITIETAKKFVSMVIKRGHWSVIEHSNMVVEFNDISRGFTHEMVRHRLCAISQESTRYVDYAKEGGDVELDKFEMKCIVPPHKDENEKVNIEDSRWMSIHDMFMDYEKFYRALRKAGWIPQDARQVLPIGIKSQIVISANFREWRHIFDMRTQRAAHWEIRKVMCILLQYVQATVPVIFDDFICAGQDNNGLVYFTKDRLTKG